MRRWPLFIALVGTLVVMLLATQQFLGLGLTRTESLSVDKFKQEELAWRVSLLRELRDDPVVTARAVVLEDGRAIGVRTTSNRDVRELGHGRYFIRDNHIRLATFDQSDPQKNGRDYSLSYPVRVPAGILWAGWGSMLLAWAWALADRRRHETGAGSAEEEPECGPAKIPHQKPWARLRDKGPSLVVLAVCVAAVIAGWSAERPFSDGAFSIKNLPYSDAYAWNHMAEQIAAGDDVTAFPGQRRFFPWMLAGVYAWTGSWLAASNVVQLGFAAAIGALVYALAAPLAGSRWVGAAAAVAAAAGPLLRHVTHVPMTEPCGLTFALAAVLLLWYGLVRQRLAIVVLAGLFYALSNLASPFTFFAAPLYALVILAYDWRIERGLWRRLRRTVILTVTVAMVYIPWLAFQKATLGSYTFSSNSAGLLYGAVSEDGAWGAAIFKEAREAGFDDSSTARDAFFMQRFKETVIEDPVAYMQIIGTHACEFLGSIERLDPAPAALAMLGLLALAAATAWRRQSLWPLVCWPALAWLAWWSHGLPPWLIIVSASVVLAMIARGRNWVPLGLILSTALAVVVINAMTGNLMPRRGWVFFDWLLLSLWLAALARLLLLVSTAAQHAAQVLGGRVGREDRTSEATMTASAGLTGQASEWPLDGRPRVPAAAYIILLGLGIWMGVSAITLSHRKLTGPEIPAFIWDEGLGDRILSDLNAPEGTVTRLVILTDHQAELLPGEEVGHYSRAFDRQEQTTTVVRPRMPRPDSITQRSALVRFAGSLAELSKTQPHMLLALESFDDSRRMGEQWLLEAVALVPLVADGQGRLHPDLERALEFEPLEPAARIPTD